MASGDWYQGGAGSSKKSSGSWYSGYDPTPPKRRKKKQPKKEEGRSLFGLAENLVHDLGDAAMGLPAGLWEVAKSVGSDTAEVFGSGDGEFELDDLAAATWDAVKWTYEPLADGDFKEFGKRVYEHPLGPVLDAFTIVTLGAGGAVRAGKAASDVGAGAKLLTGGKVRELKDGEKAEVELAKLRAGRGRGARKVGAVSRDGSRILEPAPRLLTSKAQRREEDLPSPLSPRSKREREEGEGVTNVGDYSENPVRRMQQRAYDAITEAVPGWSERRISHATRKTQRNVARRQSGLAGFQVADKALRQAGEVDPKVGRDIWNKAQGKDAAAEVARLERERERILDKSDRPEREAAFLDRIVGKAQGARATDAVMDALAEIAPQRDRSRKIVEELDRKKESGIAVDPDAHQAAFVKARQLDDQYRLLAAAAPDPEGAVTQAVQLAKARADKDLVLPQLEATYRIQRALADGRLTGKEKGLVTQLMRVLAPVAKDTDARLAEGAALRGAAGPSSSKIISDEDRAAGRFNVPHTADRSRGGRGARQSAAGRRDPQRPPRPDSSRRDTGYNDRFGLDAARPENVLATHRAATLWTQTMRSWKVAIEAMRPIPDGGIGYPPKGYKAVPAGVASRFYDNMRSFIDDEAPVIFGEGSPVLAEMRDSLVNGLGERFSSGPQMVPEKLYDGLMKEMQPRKRLPLFDQVTGLWRLSVVSPLRPAFVVNNIVGQSALLLLANSSLRGFKSAFDYGRNKELREFMRPYMGAVEGSGQSAVLGRETTDMLRSQGRLAAPMATARNLNEGLGRFSQAITDDPFRRIAFAQEALPAARTLVKAKRKEGVTGPDGRRYEMKDALEELLQDEAVIDRIERKVLGDLVDFDDLTAAERDYVRRVLPFWSWIKGSSKLTIQLALDNPLYADFLFRLGTEGAKTVQEGAGGPLPDYMRGLIGLDDGGEDGMDKAMTTAQYNPFVTPSDLLAQGNFMARRLTGREVARDYGPDNPISAANPIFKAGFSAFTGKDPFTGRDSSGLDVLANSFPLVGGFRPGGAAHQDDGIYTKGIREELFKYLGIPMRNVDVDKAITQEINPWQSVEFSAPAIDTRTEAGRKKLAELRAKLKEQYANG